MLSLVELHEPKAIWVTAEAAHEMGDGHRLRAHWAVCTTHNMRHPGQLLPRVLGGDHPRPCVRESPVLQRSGPAVS